MASFLDLLTQNQPNVQTRQALLILGLQNDFISSDGKLPVDLATGFLQRIEGLVPIFRENAGDVIWVQTVFKGDRSANDPTGNGDTILLDPEGGLVSGSEDEEDEEPLQDVPAVPSKLKGSNKQRALLLLKKVGAKRNKPPSNSAPPTPEPTQALMDSDEDENFLADSSREKTCCRPGTTGLEFHASATNLMDKDTDTIFQTSYYSAFNSTPLLINLRAKLITELYICGCLSNVSVFATALDAARHGIAINILEDCLGYRKLVRHEEAMKQIEAFMGAYPVSSEEVLTALSKPSDEVETVDRGSKEDAALRDLVQNLRIQDDKSEAGQSVDKQKKLPDHLQKEVEAALARNAAAVVSSSSSNRKSNGTISNGTDLPQGADHRARPGQEKSDHLVKAKVKMRQRSKRPATEKLRALNATPRDEDPIPAPSAISNTTPAPSPVTSPPVASPLVTSPPVSTNPATTRPVTMGSRSSVASVSSAASKQTSTTAPQSPVTALPAVPPVKEKKLSKREQVLKLAKSHMSLKSVSNSAGSPISPTRPKSFFSLRASSSVNLNKDTDSTGPRPHSLSSMGKKTKALAPLPARNVQDEIAERDSHLIHDFFPITLRHVRRSMSPVKDEMFQWLYNEVRWQKMYHAAGEVPRLVCAQGEFGKDGSMPIYRHPSDHALPLLHFSPSVELIREQVERLVNHPVNHVLIQLYRTGHDFISEHSDKTLDIVRGTSIVNVSFGAERTMRLRTKKSNAASQTTEDTASSTRNIQRVTLPHNSMFVLGQESNQRWLHGIYADKRREAERSTAEKAYSGMRISLTFRHIGTFLDAQSQTIWGQGAMSKDRATANDVINDDDDETQALINAFGFENQSIEFDWNTTYGGGFDVLHFRKPPPEHPLLFTTHNAITNAQITTCLTELGIVHTVCEPPSIERKYEKDRDICFRDIDTHHTEVLGPVSILLYLDRYHHIDRNELGKPASAAAYDMLFKIDEIRKAWTEVRYTFAAILDELEEKQALHRGDFIAGARFSIADCAAWPVLDAVIRGWQGWNAEGFPRLSAWYERIGTKRKAFKGLRKGSLSRVTSN